jgi:hypothetical protein
LKKLLVLVLAVVLTLSLAVVASAATFDPYVGGEFELTYSPDAYETKNADGSTNDSVASGELKNDANGARFKSYVTGTVKDEDTGTWAKIGVKFTSWDYSSTIYDGKANGTAWDEVYEAGIKVNDNLTVWYTNDENNDMDRGQIPLIQNWFKFGGDPFFDKGPSDGLGIRYGSETFDGALHYAFDKTNPAVEDANVVIAAATFKFDGGSFYVGYDDESNDTSHTIVGAAYKFGFGTLKVDYNLWGNDAAGADDTSAIQVAADLLDSKLTVTVLSDDKQYFAKDGGLGFGITYNINDTWYVGGRSIQPSEDQDKLKSDGSTNTNSQDVYYLGFKYGVFDTRIGSFTYGDDDSCFFIMTHVGMW